MRELGAALNAAAAEARNDTDAEYLQANAWPEVVAVALTREEHEEAASDRALYRLDELREADRPETEGR